MQNYFNYFTEVEERFQKRRGTALLLNTLDWALIETWRDAGIPLEAALQGIDNAFDKYDARAQKAKMRRVNGLAWCAQAVMEASEAMGEAAIGLDRGNYAIHGTNDPASIGGFVSHGCIRMYNADILDLFQRVPIGAKVAVVP